MELITKLCYLHKALIENGAVLVTVSLAQKFAVYCKMSETKTEAEISNNKYLFTLKKQKR